MQGGYKERLGGCLSRQIVAHETDRSHVFSIAELFRVDLYILLLNCFYCFMCSVEHTSSLPACSHNIASVYPIEQKFLSFF